MITILLKVSELVEISKSLDPMECIRITPEGAVVVDIGKEIPDAPDALTKWLVGISCGIVVAGSIALDIFVPALMPVSGALSGAAIEAFVQVIFENQAMDNVNWGKVAVSAVSGALMSWACPLASSKVVDVLGKKVVAETIEIFGKKISTEALLKIAGYATLTFSNSLVSGSTTAAFSAIDGKSSDEIFDSFLIGSAVGGACTIAASALSEIGNYAMNAIAKSNPNNWFIKASEQIGNFIDGHQVHLKNQKLEEVLAPKSVYEATKCAMKEIYTKNFKSNELIRNIKNLISENNSNFEIVDSVGNKLTKEQLMKNGGNGNITLKENCDSKFAKIFKEHNIDRIPIKNGEPDFSKISEYSFMPDGGITPDRTDNYNRYYKQLAKAWSETPESAPQEILNVLSEDEIKNITSSKVPSVLSKAKLSPQESQDGFVYLVDMDIHKAIKHRGGVDKAAAWAKIEAVISYFKQITTSTVSGITGVLIAEGAS